MRGRLGPLGDSPCPTAQGGFLWAEAWFPPAPSLPPYHHNRPCPGCLVSIDPALGASSLNASLTAAFPGVCPQALSMMDQGDGACIH